MFKRTIAAVTILIAMLCLTIGGGNAAEFEYKAADVGSIGNGNGHPGGFHDPDWNIEPIPPVPTPVDPNNLQEDNNTGGTTDKKKKSDKEKKPDKKKKSDKEQEDISRILEPVTFNPGDTWLIYYYVCATDLEEDTKNNFREIQQVTEELKNVGKEWPSNVTILIRIGATSVWHSKADAGIPIDDGLWLYSSDSKGFKQLKSLNEDMGNPETLSSFLEYGEKNYKADHKVLIFQDHGNFNGVCKDKAVDPHDQLILNDLHAAFAAFYKKFPQTSAFELLAFDTCLSGSYECAKSLEGFTRYMMASETETYSWNYTPWLTEFAKNTAIDGGTLGRIICEETHNAHRDNQVGEYDGGINLGTHKDLMSLAVIDMSKMQELTNAYDKFFEAATTKGRKTKGFYALFDRIAKNRNENGGSEHYVDNVDLGQLAERTKNLFPDGEAESLRAAVEDAVSFNLPGNRRNGLGISTYYPYNPQRMEEFATINAVSENQKKFYRNLRHNVRDTASQPQPSGGGGLQSDSNPDPYNIQALEGTPLTIGEDYHVTATLTPEQLESVSHVRCAVLVGVDPQNTELTEALGVKDAAAVYIGNDVNVKVDWQAGTFKDNFNAKWSMFDGHIVLLHTDFSTQDYILYTVPIYHKRGDDDREERILKVAYSIPDQKYFILGVCDDVDENGVPSGTIDALEAGDEITPMFLAMVPKGSKDVDENPALKKFEMTTKDGNKIDGYLMQTEGATFTVSENSKIEDRPLPNAPYGYGFMFYSPDGNKDNFATSQGVYFEVKDGKVVNAVLNTDEVKEAKITDPTDN